VEPHSMSPSMGLGIAPKGCTLKLNDALSGGTQPDIGGMK